MLLASKLLLGDEGRDAESCPALRAEEVGTDCCATLCSLAFKLGKALKPDALSAAGLIVLNG